VGKEKMKANAIMFKGTWIPVAAYTAAIQDDKDNPDPIYGNGCHNCVVMTPNNGSRYGFDPRLKPYVFVDYIRGVASDHSGNEIPIRGLKISKITTQVIFERSTTIHKAEISIAEADFGSSTSCLVEYDKNGVILSFQDTSDYQTNYVWDGWDGIDLIGRKIKDVDGEVVFSDEYRLASLRVNYI
jgi:hypothetical protein